MTFMQHNIQYHGMIWCDNS